MWNRWNRRGGGGNQYRWSKPKKSSWGCASESLGVSSWLPDGVVHSQAERDSWMDSPSTSCSQQAAGDAADDDDANHMLLGTVKGPVVGLQYYNGEVNTKEMVSLVREPRNPYDSNAVKVENIWGQQVGHVKRDLASALAFIVDNKLARLEGLVPSGKGNMYRMQVEISFWGNPDKLKPVSDKLGRYGYVLKSNLVEEMGPGGSAAPPVYRPQAAKGKSVTLTHAEMQNKLDSLFENLKQEAKNIELEPAKAIKTTLYPHQKQALHWMCVRENNKDLPHFWKDHNGKYLNTVTNFISQTKPPCVHGGILADEMGLGKTLEVISLILTNFHGGRPLAEPGTELVREGEESAEEDEFDTEEEEDMEDDDTKDDEGSQNKQSGAAAFMRKDDPDYSPVIKIDTPPAQIVTEVPAAVVEIETGTDSQVVDLTNSEETGVKDEEKLATSGDVVDLTKEDSMKMEAEPVQVEAEKPVHVEAEKPVKVEAVAESSSRRPRRAAKKPVRYNYSDDEEIEDLLMEADIIPKKKAKSSKPRKSKEEKEEYEPKEKEKKKSKGKKSNKGGKGKKSANAMETAAPALPTLDMPEDDPPAPSKRKSKKAKAPKAAKTAKAAPSSNPSVTVVPGIDAANATQTGPRPTLIVCPLSVMSNWLDQFEQHVSPYVRLNIYNYYGNDRTKDSQLLSAQDVVLTTYNTLAADYKAKKENSALHKVKWLRVVLDEAHIIRNPAALQTKAVLAITTERKWALTGTPIQNSIKDLWPLMAFIKLEPFATDRQWWMRTITRPIGTGDKTALDRLASLMDAVALRRTKMQKVKGRLMVDLPEKKVVLTKLELKGEERQLYDTMAKEGKVTIGKYFRTGTLLTNYGHVLAILLRLRQLCCHPSLVAAAAAAMAAQAEDDGGGTGCSEELKKKLVATLLAVLSQGADEECCVCLDSLNRPVITPCAHVFCERCINDVIKTEGEGRTTCPLCRGPVIREQLVHVPVEAQEANKNQATEGEWHSSTKVDALMEQLIKVRDEDKSIKSLVVSQFTTLLNLLEKPLRDSGFKFVRLDGSMSLQKRVKAIEALMSTKPSSPTIMLLSLKAGGLGINLTTASRVYLMDPAWNPAAEDQCFDRCHRLGQTKEVIVTKFVIENSVEDRMLELQEKKRGLMSGAFGKKVSADERRQARVNDIKVLMDIIASQI